MGLLALLKKKNNKTLFTTPSHGGKFCICHKFYQWYKSDISEVDAYNPEEALEASESWASSIYGTKYTKYLTNGSTSGIIAAVLASNAKKILIWDSAHPCHKNACKLANVETIEYNLPRDEELGIYKAITLEKVIKLLREYLPEAIIITSPTYEGFVADVEGIAKTCREMGVKLIVDEAHGALYPFAQELPISAVKLADYTVQSLHKTAGGINPTALVHSNDNDLNPALSLITTTSPSYPMLATIEANIRFLNSIRGRKIISELISNIKSLGINQYNDDATKILLKGGYKLSDKLFNDYGIEDERTNEKTTMLLCGIGTTKVKLQKLKKVLNNLGL